ncbi:oncostatin-M-specific receptor subunit beta [Podarcis muralis]
MERLVLQMVVLYVVLHSGLFENQDRNLFQPRNLEISMNIRLQQLSVKWHVGDDSEAYYPETDLVFNIQVKRTEEKIIDFPTFREIPRPWPLQENYTTTVSKTNRHLQWNWTSKIPLECVAHAVRIRSTVRFSEVWSDWSPWKIADGMDVVNIRWHFLWPEGNKFVEMGSDVKYCCIGAENKSVPNFYFGDKQMNVGLQRRVFVTLKNVPRSKRLGYTIQCDSESASLFVTNQPDKPKDLACKTEDMINLECTWHPSAKYMDAELLCPASFTLSDGSSNETYCSSISSPSCSFKIGKQTIYNLILTSRNCIGEKLINLTVDVAHRVHPAAPYKLLAGYTNATTIQLQWQINEISEALSLLCEIHGASRDGEQKMVIVQYSKDSHPQIILDGLQPSTNYTLKVRCGAARHFWKWSKWSESKTIPTNETAPSGQMDIWRDINSCLENCNITIFWKASPDFHAHGRIVKYEILWEKLEEPTETHRSDISPTLNNCTISLGNSSYKISVSARNSVDASHPATIVISAAEDDGNMNCSMEDTQNNTEHGIYIAWQSQSRFDGYVVDWCNNPKSHLCDFQWKKFGPNDSSALITHDAFESHVRYTFWVYGTIDDRAHLLEKKTKYLNESDPAHEPDNLKTHTVTSHSFTLTWEFDHLNETHPGFIRGYYVYVKKEHGNCTLLPDHPVHCIYTIEDPNLKAFTVRNLEPSTHYEVGVKAYSVGSQALPKNFRQVLTLSDDGNGWLQNLLPLVIVPSVLLLAVCIWKSECVKNSLKIPHPDAALLKIPQVKSGPMEISETPPSKLQLIGTCPGPVSKQPPLPIFVENWSYFKLQGCETLPSQKAASKERNLPLTSYQPLERFGFGSTAISHPPGTSQGDFDSLSQTEVPLSVGSVEPSQPLVYKPQLPQESKASTPGSDDEMVCLTAIHC